MSHHGDARSVLKAELWRRFGNPEYPAEWDGTTYGGGVLSQRFWEYHKAIDLLDIAEDSVILDIGGFSRETGRAFFGELLAEVARKVIVLDPTIGTSHDDGNVEYISQPAGEQELRRLCASQPTITHAVSISVLEHIAPSTREAMFKVIDENFGGDSIVATFEYQAKKVFCEHQLTARTAASLFSQLSRFYLDEMSASPVWCEGAFVFDAIPLWYPVAVKFRRKPSSVVPSVG